MGAVPIYEPEEERGKRGRGPGRPKQVCMQAAGAELRRDLAKEERAVWEVEIYGPQDIKRMWTGVTRGEVEGLVDRAHATERGVESGGSGSRACDLLPTKRMWERTTYVIARRAAGHVPMGAGQAEDGQAGMSTARGEREAGAGRGADGGNGSGGEEGGVAAGVEVVRTADKRVPGGRAATAEEVEEWEWDADAELGIELEVEKELGRAAEGGEEQEPPPEAEPYEEGGWAGAREPSTAGSSPEVSMPGSAVSTVISTPVPSRPPSPAAERRRRVYGEDDMGSDDERETIGDMVSRLLRKQQEAERAYERRRSLAVRGALNARTGFTYMLRVGEVEPAEHGRGHERRKAAEGSRVGRATAAEDGAGPGPRPRAVNLHMPLAVGAMPFI